MVRLTGITVTKNDIYWGRLETEIVDTEISTLNGLELLQALLFQAKAAAQTNWIRSNYQHTWPETQYHYVVLSNWIPPTPEAGGFMPCKKMGALQVKKDSEDRSN